MKKSIKFLFAALAILTVASCAKEELIAPVGGGALRTFTVSLSDTKTSLEEGKVVWNAGDSLWISNGTEVSSWIVPDDAEGQKAFSFTTALAGDLYVVYPATAAKGVKDGKLTVVIPGAQDGSFSSANICVGKATDDFKVQMHNATAIAKISVHDDALDVKTLSISSVGTALAGDCDITFSGTAIATAVPGEVTFGGITVEDASGELFVAVIPGTYPAGFQFSAISTEFTTESKTTLSAKTLNFNDITNLGAIGTNMAAPAGAGTEGDPYQITNLAEWLALAYNVSNDPANTMEGKYFKVINDIDGITVPVGGLFNDGENDVDYYFKGNLDGNNKTLKVNINGKQTVALIGDATAPASFKNVKVAGVINASGNYAAGLVGMLNGGAGVTFTNCENSAAVTGAGYVGGIVGYNDGITSFTDCTNSGKLVGKGNFLAGISAVCGKGTFTNCKNKGEIISKAGQCVGGICGRFNDNAVFDQCTNNGDITSSDKYTGGIAAYGKDKPALTITKCVNNGHITPGVGTTSYTSNGALSYTQYDSYCGGILGYFQGPSATADLVFEDCVNNGDIDASKAGGYTCGIVGFIQDGSSQNGAKYIVNNCQNYGAITGVSTTYPNISEKPSYVYYIAGISGYTGHTTIQSCTNYGTISAPAAGYVSGVEATNRNAKVLDCVNEGNVTGKNYVAGISGYQNWSQCNRCTNKGAIKGTSTIVGGVVAYNHKAGGIYSCGNEGSVVGTQQVGGVAGLMTNQTNQSMQNCYNVGAVNYASSESTNPLTGGIVGRHQFGNILNVYNTGKVGCANGEIAEAAKVSLGAISGVLGSGQTVNYCYFLEGTFDVLCGGANPYEGKFYAVQADGTFKDGASVLFEGTLKGDLESSKIDETLNNWIVSKNDTWLTWVFTGDTTPGFGPKYVKL